jgi:SAM-dependent methyltransferase
MAPVAALWRRLRSRRAAGAEADGASLSGLAYWEWRARRYGARAVLHVGHGEDEIAAVTRLQGERLRTVLARHLRGGERLALDFGCGTGRLTPLLAEAIAGRALGVDPVASLLQLAPAHGACEFRVLEGGRIPVPSGRVDVALVCLVLGGIPDGAPLDGAAAEIDRVLAPGGLLVLAENTSAKPDRPHWAYRPLGAYRRLFPAFDLAHEGDYDDLGERISILAGRRRDAWGA